MVEEWQQQEGDMHHGIDLSTPIDDKDLSWNNMDMIDDEDDVATTDEDSIAVASASKKRVKGAKGRQVKRHRKKDIQQLEAMFQECPHPSEGARMALSKSLGMDPLKVKFWFQNRRSAKKNQDGRQENKTLRIENEMLEAENRAMKAAMLKKRCPRCTGQMTANQMSPESRRLLMERVALQAEILRAKSYLHFISGGKATSSRILCDLNADGTDDALEVDPVVPMPPHHEDLVADTMGHGGSAEAGIPEQDALQKHALGAMVEFMMLVKQGEPMWLPTPDGEMLDHQVYRESTYPGILELPPMGFAVNGTRDTGMVMCTGVDLVKVLMDENSWAQAFPGIVASVTATKIGTGCICEGGLLLMNADLRVLSPQVPSCKVKFVRQCEMVEQGVWAVVDVSLDGRSDLTPWNNDGMPGACRLLPSGCLIEDLNNGSCKVTWIVNAEYNKTFVPQLFHPLFISGHAFSVCRWLTSLQRRCEYLLQISSPNLGFGKTGGSAMPLEGRNNVLELARRMTESFYVAISSPPRGQTQAWSKVTEWRGNCGGGNECFQLAVRVVTLYPAPGERADAGLVLCAGATVRLPEIPPQRVFDYIRDAERRGEWDMLANGAPVKEGSFVNTTQFPHSGVSILCPTQARDGSNNKKLILQQVYSDAPCMVVAYAPLDASTLKELMNGGSHASYSLLPSGFAILPDGNGDTLIDPTDANPSVVDAMSHQRSHGSLVSMLLQTKINGPLPKILTPQTTDKMGNLFASSLLKIKDAVHAKKVITA